jgi:hypothetical protein
MGDRIGDFEQLVLFAIVRLGADVSTVTIRQQIEALARACAALRRMASGLTAKLQTAKLQTLES